MTGYILQITFGDGTTRDVNFLKAFTKYAQGYYSKYLELKNFKKFKIDNDNVVWGKDWDIIFDTETLYNGKIETNP